MTFEMICTCRIDGFLPTEERRLRIFNRMRLDDKETLTTAIVLSLAFDFKAEVDLLADQWFGLSLDTPLLEDGLYIECDNPEDGLAYMWEHLAEKFPERASSREKRKSNSEGVAALVSAALVEQLKSAETHWRSMGRIGDERQPDAYYAGLELLVIAEHTIRNTWGGNALDAAIAKAFGE
jgi:hypothetical protein